jgi:hypothetical protein
VSRSRARHKTQDIYTLHTRTITHLKVVLLTILDYIQVIRRTRKSLSDLSE